MRSTPTTVKARAFNPGQQAPSPCVTVVLPAVAALIDPAAMRFKHGLRIVKAVVRVLRPYVDELTSTAHAQLLEEIGPELAATAANGVSMYAGAKHECMRDGHSLETHPDCPRCVARGVTSGQQALATAFGALHEMAPKNLCFINGDARCWGMPGRHLEMAKLFTGKMNSHDDAMRKVSVDDLDATALCNIISWCKAFPAAMRGREGKAQAATKARNLLGHEGLKDGSFTEEEYGKMLAGMRGILECVAAEPDPHGERARVALDEV